MRFLNSAIILSAVLIFTSKDTLASGTGKSFSDIISSILPMIAESEEVKRFSLLINSAKLDISAQKLDAPWSLQSSVNREDKTPFPPDGDSERTEAYGLTNKLDYLTRSGFDISTSATNFYSETENRDNPSTDDPLPAVKGKTYRLTSTVGYELNKGGENSPANLQAKALTAQTRVQLLSTQQSLQQFFLGAYNMVGDYYLALCKLQNLRMTLILNEKITSTARTKSDAKLLTRKDLLTYINAEANLKLRIAAQIEAVEKLRNDFFTIDPAVAAYIGQIDEKSVQCEESADTLVGSTRAQDVKSEALFTNDLQRKIAQENSQVAELRLRQLQKQNDFSLKPFINGEYTYAPDANVKDIGKVSIGTSFSWTIPVKKTDLGERALIVNRQAAAAAANKAETDARTRIAGYSNQIRIQTLSAEIAKNSLESAKELLDLLRTGSDAGLVDTTAYASAQISFVEAKERTLDAWLGIRKLLFEIQFRSEQKPFSELTLPATQPGAAK